MMNLFIGLGIGLVIGVILAAWGFLSIPRAAAHIMRTPPEKR